MRAAAINNPRKWAHLLPPEEAAKLLGAGLVDRVAYDRALDRLQDDAELHLNSELAKRLAAREAQIEILGKL